MMGINVAARDRWRAGELPGAGAVRRGPAGAWAHGHAAGQAGVSRAHEPADGASGGAEPSASWPSAGGIAGHPQYAIPAAAGGVHALLGPQHARRREGPGVRALGLPDGLARLRVRLAHHRLAHRAPRGLRRPQARGPCASQTATPTASRTSPSAAAARTGRRRSVTSATSIAAACRCAPCCA